MISQVIHGESGAGKSWLIDTAPKPLLVLDAEGGSQFTPSQPKILWDPIAQPPPASDGTWSTARVMVRDFATMDRVFQWLNSGQHHFKSVGLDSTTEIQKRCLDVISGTQQPRQQDYGQLLRDMETLIRQFRDLTFHPTNPLSYVGFITTTMMENDAWRPSLIGALRNSLPYFVDIVGYLYTEVNGQTSALERKLLVQNVPGYVAKDRTGRLGTVVDDPDVTRMMEVIYGTE